MSVQDLFSKKPRSMPLSARYNEETLAKYAADLRFVVDQMADGRARPTWPALIEHFKTEYGVEVGSDTLRRHIEILQKGEELWPSKTS